MKVKALSAIIPYLGASKQKEMSRKTIYSKHPSQSEYLRRVPLLFCEGQKLFHLWSHILMSLVLYLNESSKQKLVRKQFILNTRFNPSIFTGETMLFCED